MTLWRYFILSSLFLLLSLPGWGANIYVDNQLTSDLAGPTNYYDPTKGMGDTCSSTGVTTKGYSTIQSAINAMSAGDKIYIRGGTYQEGHINIPTSKNASGPWTEGNYNYLGSYPGEWAIIDGQGTISNDNRGTVLGQIGYAFPYNGITYWMLERLEITGGGGPSTEYAYGFVGSWGPFWIRYCYIHDNYVRDGGTGGTFANGGLSGYCWQDSIVEYCSFARNGCLDSSNNNVSEINIASDYLYATIVGNGFDPTSNGGRHNMRNTYRYNYFELSRGSHGIKYKAGQYFSGKSEATVQETYNTYGDKIHHNIFLDALSGGIKTSQDFIQIYNNIFDGCVSAIKIGETSDYDVYKGVTYNNTIIDGTQRALFRLHKEYFEGQIDAYYGYDYNNILDNGADYDGNAELGINAIDWETDEDDYSTYVGDRNYFYRPAGTSTQKANVFSAPDNVYFTTAEYMAEYSGTTLWNNDYDAENLLYAGTSGASKYIPRDRGAHIISGATTIANGGYNAAHPYLSGVTIPRYVGAVNPSDSDWVAGVLSLATYTNLRDATAGSDPSWIEGSESTPPSTPSITGVMTGIIR